MKKTYNITYIDLCLNERTGTQKAICKEMADILFRLTHGVWKIISIEEV